MMLVHSFLVCACYFIIGSLSIIASGSSENNSSEELTSRIFFGTPVRSADYPYFAILDGCGGAVISDTWIITAAHCVTKDVLIAQLFPRHVCVGGVTESQCYGYTYNRVVIHPGYEDTGEIKDDIALVQLTQKLRFSPEIQPTQLPKTSFTSGWVTLVGKGLDETNKVSETVMKVNLYGYDSIHCPERGNGEVFCAIRDQYLAGTCFGDSGSPLVRGRILIGIVSSIGDSSCSDNKYTFAISVYNYLPWIKSVTGLY